MKKVLGVLLTTTILSSTALANGAPEPCVQAAPSWTSWKLGVQLGYAHSANDAKFRKVTGNQNTVLLANDLASDGVIGGFHAGYDQQFNSNWTYGVEVFIDFSDVDGSVSGRNANSTAKMNASMDWGLGITARLGYALNDSLFYGGVGLVGYDWDVKGVSNGTFTTSDDKFAAGLRLTLGAAQRFDNILLGLEGNYTFFEKISASQKFQNGAFTDHAQIEPRMLDVKVKLSYML